MSPVSQQQLAEPRRRLQEMVRRRIGLNAYAKKNSEFDGDEEVWAIHTTYPMELNLSSMDQPVVRFVGQPNIGNAYIRREKSLFKVVLPERDELEKVANDRSQGALHRAERTMIETVERKFVSIPQVYNALNPIIEILRGVSGGPVPLSAIAQARGDRTKAKRYVDLLASLKFVKAEGEAVHAGPRFQKVEDVVSNRAEIHMTMLAQIAAEGYAYLRDYMHLTSLTPFVRSSNSYYLTSAYVGDAVPMTQKEISENYTRLYHSQRNMLKFGNHLASLVDAKILDKTDDRFIGEPEIFTRYAESFEAA